MSFFRFKLFDLVGLHLENSRLKAENATLTARCRHYRRALAAVAANRTLDSRVIQFPTQRGGHRDGQ